MVIMYIYGSVYFEQHKAACHYERIIQEHLREMGLMTRSSPCHYTPSYEVKNPLTEAFKVR